MKKLYMTALLGVLLVLATTPQLAAGLGNNWVRCGGPLGGLGYDVRMHPDNPDTMFVTDAFAGVFKSTDGGVTWFPSNNGITKAGGMSGDAIPVFCLTIDQNNPRTIWCGQQYRRGIFKSTDGGENWTELVNGIPQTQGITIRGITIDYEDSDIVYAAAEFSSWYWSGGPDPIVGREFDKTMGVIYKTTDGGLNWNEIWRGNNLARYVWIDPRDSQVLYASTGIFDREAADSDTTTNDPGGEGVLKSYDGGVHWEARNNGLTNLYVGSLFMHPENPDILLAGCANNAYPQGEGVFLTEDGGDNWTKVLSEGAQSVEFSISQPHIAYAGHPGSIFMSEDGGGTWHETTPPTSFSWGPPGIMAGFPIDFQVDPHLPERMFANNYGGGNFLTVDGGANWTAASAGYTGAQVRDIVVAPYDDARVYAAARSGIFLSPDAGTEWVGLIYAPAYGLEWNVVDISPHDPLHMLAGNNYTGTIYECHDGAGTWRDVGNPLPAGRAWRCFAFAPSDTMVIYGGTGAFLSAGQFAPEMSASGIHKSPDGGLTWGPANDAVSGPAHVAELAVDPTDENVVYAATTNLGILKTTDGGLSWRARNDGLSELPVALTVTVHPAEPARLFAGVADHGLYSSDDGGLSWTQVPVGLPAEASVSSIVFNPIDHELIYLADQRSGVYRSHDGGVNWVTVNTGLRTRAVNALALSAEGMVLYAATEGEGVFRLDGAGALSAVERPPSASLIDLEPSYPNPFNPVTTIVFNLGKPTRVTLGIYDTGGRLVRTLLDESRGAGRHRLVWDGRDDGGQAVASGVYLYRLVGAGVDRTRKMVLVR